MRTKKTWLVCAIAVFLLCCLLPGKAQAATYGDLTYSVTNGEVTITYCDTSVSGDYVIPDTINGCPVTTIGTKAFYNCTLLTGITIPDTVTSIGDSAFQGCAKLESVTIPDGVTSIGSKAFYNTALTTVKLPDGLTGINSDLFRYRTKLESITLPDNISYVDSGAFACCISLTDIVIPDSVTRFGSSVFSQCTSLESITIPFVGYTRKTQSDKYQYPFGALFGTDFGTNGNSGCYSAIQYYYGSSTTSTTYTAYYIPKSLKSVTVTGGEILYGAFYGCSSLENIAVTGAVSVIAKGAFYNCSGLTTFTIGDCVTDISSEAFYSKNNVKHLIIAEGSETVTQTMVICKETLETVYVPSSVTCIEKGAFSGCGSLQSMTLPFANSIVETSSGTRYYPLGYIFGTESFVDAEGVMQAYYDGRYYSRYETYYIPTALRSVTLTGGEMYGCTFDGCKYLTDVYLPEGITGLGGLMFNGCTGLREVTIPEGVSYIGVSAFEGCTGLSNISLPSTVREIDRSAFKGCTGLAEVTIPEGVTYIGESAFKGCNGLYDISIACTVRKIGASAFEGCVNLYEIIIPVGVTDIGDYAFKNCYGLWEIIIPEGVLSIGDYAFENCASLSNISIPESIISVGYSAFNACTYNTYDNGLYLGNEENPYCVLIKPNSTNITYCNIHQDTKAVSDRAFEDCKKLTDVSIPQNVVLISDFMFYGCTALKEITLPDSITKIGAWAFYNTGLTSITIPEGVAEIGDWAFYYSGLTSITIPEGVTQIGIYAFENCYSLTHIMLPSSLRRIGEGAFWGSAITNVVIPDGITELESDLFRDCSNLASVRIPDSMTTICYGAFDGCESLCDVIYCGTPSQWDQILIDVYNTSLETASRTYHSFAEADCVTPKTCSFCGDTEGAALGHDWLDASCTVSGTCAVCGTIGEPPLGHSGDLWFDLAAPTCTEPGIKARICDVCGETETVITDALGHSYESVVTAPTCTKQGYTTNTCGACGVITVTDYVDVIEHNYISAVTEPTCTQQGYTTNTCTVCGDVTVTDYVAALGHSYESVVAAPTCTEQGYTTNTCSVCDAVTVTDYVDATGHSFGDWTQTKAPNCTEAGEESRSCFCGETEVQSVAALGHSYDAVVTAPTCTEQGYTTNTCSVCGDVTVTDYVDAKGHGWSAWIQTKAPSCNTEGTQVRFCNCGVRETQTLARLTHTIGADGCTHCGAFDTYHWVLSADANVEVSLTQDLYVDLNGFDLSGTVTLNGYKIYGMDSTTDSYTCDEMGYFSCVDAEGNAIVPESHFKGSTETIGSVKRYMTVHTENGYTFHRFYLGVTHASIKPGASGVGYKAVFAGDEMVQTTIESYGCSLQLDGFEPVTAEKAGSPVSGKAFTVRINGFDVDTYGETPLTAQVYITVNGETISASAYTTTLKAMVQAVDADASKYTVTQLAALKVWLGEYTLPKSWNLTNI